jgi:class 3 adenylate cyclase
VTLLFTDLVGFSSWALEVGDDTALLLLRRVASALEPPVTATGARWSSGSATG